MSKVNVKVVISGASGSVGSQLVPLLVQAGHTLLLISRDVKKLTAQFPGINVTSLDTWETCAGGYDIFLHLAVLKVEGAGISEGFERVNSDLTGTLAAGARRAGIPRFIYPSPIQVLLPGRKSRYIESKRAGESDARANFGEFTEIIYLGRILRSRQARRQSHLYPLAWGLESFFSSFLSAFHPTTSIKAVAGCLDRPGAFGSDQAAILTDRQTENSCYQIWRAMIDVAFVTLTFLLLPFVMVAWLAVLVEDGRPGFFSQERVGRGEVFFRCLKLRTMRSGTVSRGTHLVSQAAITGVGRGLRQSKIDELPQAWNIIRGEMSLIGPRPCLPNQLEVVAARRLRGIFNYRPGLTGWAQVNGIDMREPEKVAKYDSQYLGLQSVSCDLWILGKTLFPSGSERDR
jgi:lipopolysaccharide/colanic/teichoic acid biosynthesis glycosyltransferase